MSEPWFDPNLFGWLPGTMLGVLGGLWGSLVGTLAPRGKGKAVVWAMYWTLLTLSVGCGCVGVAGWVSGQPWMITFALLLPGALGLLILAPLGYVAKLAYRRVEEMKMRAGVSVSVDSWRVESHARLRLGR